MRLLYLKWRAPTLLSGHVFTFLFTRAKALSLSVLINTVKDLKKNKTAALCLQYHNSLIIPLLEGDLHGGPLTAFRTKWRSGVRDKEIWDNRKTVIHGCIFSELLKIWVDRGVKNININSIRTVSISRGEEVVQDYFLLGVGWGGWGIFTWGHTWFVH